ncbi:MAG TPA: hypothetical protein VGQ81_03325 [Acidobacteriota bacterium]|jgi:membrane protein implicated in regulation of membrane protease activity|nr:hypothetical protein [Acidobacteriota bacterium]
MTWENFYLVCFVFGFALSLLSFLSVSLHIPVRWHWPHPGAHHAGGIPHVQVGHASHAAAGHASASNNTSQISPYNFSTLMAFIAWFGGAGYLMSHYYRGWFLLGLAVALVSGMAGASVVFWSLAKVLLAHEQNLDPADYELVGVLATVTSSIRSAGTGEIIFSQEGTRHVSGARSENGAAIAKGEEVVITHYERGIAYVQRWKEFSGADG